MKIRVVVIIILVSLFCGSVAVAEIEPFEYSFATPNADDLTREEAETISDAYFSNRSDRIVILNEDITKYDKTTNFIRIVQKDEPMYCWVVAYNDGKRMLSGYGFVGLVIVSSPDGRIVDYCSDSYWECFAEWESALIAEKKRSEIWGAIDLIALPNENRIKHVLPDMYTIHETEALSIAHQLVAGYQHIAENDVELNYSISIWLDRDLLVSEHPIWHIQYIRYQDAQVETPIPNQLHYTVTLYAHTGSVWYVIDHMSNQALYADHTGCHMPITEETFEPAEWQLSDYSILFRTP